MFVHGIQGHPLKTWLHDNPPSNECESSQPKSQNIKAGWRERFKSRKIAVDQSSEQPTDASVAEAEIKGFYWPMELGADCPHARIITFGYDSDVTHYFKLANKNNIRDHARALLNAVVGERTNCVSKHRRAKGNPSIVLEPTDFSAGIAAVDICRSQSGWHSRQISAFDVVPVPKATRDVTDKPIGTTLFREGRQKPRPDGFGSSLQFDKSDCVFLHSAPRSGHRRLGFDGTEHCCSSVRHQPDDIERS